MRLDEAEEFARTALPGVAVALREADLTAEPGSAGWTAMRAEIFAMAAGRMADPYARDTLLWLAHGEEVALQLTGPVEHRSAEVSAALTAQDPGLLALAAQRGIAGLPLGGDEPMSPDFGYQYAPVSPLRLWIPQRPAGAQAAAPGGTQGGAQPRRGKAAARRRNAQQRRRLARARAVQRFRHRKRGGG
jgi:hypothetical protein